jgi:hypothetical protein
MGAVMHQVPMSLNRSTGFTLMETILVVFATAVILLAILNLFDRHGVLYSFQQAGITVTADSRRTLNDLQYLVVQSNRVLSSRTIGGTNYSSDSDTLVLQIPSIDSSRNIISSTWDYAAIYISNGKLYRVLEGNAGSARLSGDRILAESLQSMTFTYDNADFTLVRRVDVDIQTQQTGRNFTTGTHEQQRMQLRNY